VAQTALRPELLARLLAPPIGDGEPGARGVGAAEPVRGKLVGHVVGVGQRLDARVGQHHLHRVQHRADLLLLAQRQRHLAQHAADRALRLEAGEQERLAKCRRPLALHVLFDQDDAQAFARQVGRSHEPAERAAHDEHIAAQHGHR
jgi:hypothetical protein